MRLATALTAACLLAFIAVAAGQTEATPHKQESTTSNASVASGKKLLFRKFWTAARVQIKLDAKFRPDHACLSIRRAIKFYRSKAWEYQDALGLDRSRSSYPERLSGRCAYLRWRTKQWKMEATRTRKELERFESGSHYERAKHIIYATFPDSTQERALGVCGCETARTYSPTIVNHSTGVTGLFQIHPGNVGTYWCWKGHGCMAHTSSTNLSNPWVNAKLALYMSQGGTNWRQWDYVCRR